MSNSHDATPFTRSVSASLAPERLQAFEAIAHDTSSLMALLLRIKDHPKSALLAFGTLPPLSMYVVESLRVVKAFSPNIAAELLDQFANRLHPLRHRAKLLDDAEKSVEQVAWELAMVAESQKRFFLNSHVGMLRPLKKSIQPDLGLFTYDGHIFTTTHSIVHNFGTDQKLAERAFSVGEALGAYTVTLLKWLDLQVSNLPPSESTLPGVIEMRDIKSQALYRRASLGKIPTEMAVGMTLLLSSLNNVRHIAQGLLPAGGHTQFRLKFIVAYHADSNLRAIQNRLASDNLLFSASSYSVFKEILGNQDSRWLRKRKTLRNLLVHYSIDERHVTAMSPLENRTQAIEYFGGRLTFSEMDALLDRHIKRMAIALERGFSLEDDPFWYGRVV